MTEYTEEQITKRFWERVDKVSDPLGCWLWTGAKDTSKYGSIFWNGKMRSTHRLAYCLTGHTIPNGLELAHSENCKGKKHCCNPKHLTPKTRIENRLDRRRDGTNGKLTPEQVIEIRQRLANGDLRKDLANEFKVEPSNISYIKLRKTWSHI
jgi:hypothetical protein